MITSFTILTTHTPATAGVNDVATLEIISPQSYSSNNHAVYSTGRPLRVEGRFKNVGTNVQRSVPIKYDIFDNPGVLLFTGRDTVRGDWSPGQIRDVKFPEEYIPTQPGTYYIQMTITLYNDTNRANDTVSTIPLWGNPFIVRYGIEVMQEGGTVFGVSPMTGATYPTGRPIMIRTAYSNYGFADADSLAVLFQIRKGDCYSAGLVYSRNIMLPAIKGTDSLGGPGPLAFVQFPDFIPFGPGIYCAVASISVPEDPVHGNDTARWTFTVIAGSSGIHGGDDDAVAGISLSVAPNPARGATTIGVRTPAAIRATLELYDASGTLVTTLARDEAINARRFELNTTGLASGAYTVRLVTAGGGELTRTLIVAR